MKYYTENFDDMADDFDCLFANPDDLSRLEALSLDAILKKKSAKVVLDCACGTGIQSIGLAEMGYQVFASDISSRMITRLVTKAKAKGINISAKVADFRTLAPWPAHSFEAVVCGGNSLPLLTSLREVARALSAMKRVVREKDGLVIIGLHNYQKLMRDGRVALLRRVDVGKNRVEIILDIRQFGQRHIKVTHLFIKLRNRRWQLTSYTKQLINMSGVQLYNIMCREGFQDLELLDITGTKPFDDEKDEWLFVVGKT